MRGEITYPLPKFKSAAVDVWGGYVILYHTLLGMWLIIHAWIKNESISGEYKKAPFVCVILYTVGLVQDSGISGALAMEML